MFKKIVEFFKRLFSFFKKKPKKAPLKELPKFDPSIFEKIADSFKRAGRAMSELSLNLLRHRKASRDFSKHGGSNNHNQSVPKYRVKMARESNRINRTRFKHWTH